MTSEYQHLAVENTQKIAGDKVVFVPIFFRENSENPKMSARRNGPSYGKPRRGG